MRFLQACFVASRLSIAVICLLSPSLLRASEPQASAYALKVQDDADHGDPEGEEHYVYLCESPEPNLEKALSLVAKADQLQGAAATRAYAEARSQLLNHTPPRLEAYVEGTIGTWTLLKSYLALVRMQLHAQGGAIAIGEALQNLESFVVHFEPLSAKNKKAFARVSADYRSVLSRLNELRARPDWVIKEKSVLILGQLSYLCGVLTLPALGPYGAMQALQAAVKQGEDRAQGVLQRIRQERYNKIGEKLFSFTTPKTEALMASYYWPAVRLTQQLPLAVDRLQKLFSALQAKVEGLPPADQCLVFKRFAGLLRALITTMSLSPDQIKVLEQLEVTAAERSSPLFTRQKTIQ